MVNYSKTSDQTVFTEFELTFPSQGGSTFQSEEGSNFTASGAKGSDSPSLPDFVSSNCSTAAFQSRALPSRLSNVAAGACWHNHGSECSDANDPRGVSTHRRHADADMGTTPDEFQTEQHEVEKSGNSPTEHRMTRVDWRWAAKKGFWDKDRKCWIEAAGGQAAYLLQRTARCKLREQRVARRVRATEHAVQSYGFPFRSGLIEELPDSAASGGDAWADCLKELRSSKPPPPAAGPALQGGHARLSPWPGADGSGLYGFDVQKRGGDG